MRFLIILLASLAVAGCASVSREELLTEAKAMGYGAPLPANWQELIKSYMADRLHDPTSAVYKFLQPRRGYVTKPPALGGHVAAAGWVIEATIDSKDKKGAFTGPRAFQFLVKDGVIIRYSGADGWPPI